jgi:hypothetical protein
MHNGSTALPRGGPRACTAARLDLPGETHRRRGMERGEKVLARAAARPRGRGRGHRGPGPGQHGGLLGHARGARDEGTLKLMVEPAQRARVLKTYLYKYDFTV